MNILIWYPKCSTCKKAKDWLDLHNIQYETRHIVEENPTKEELENWYQQNQYELKKFFNTSGILYKEKNLKEKLPMMTEKEKLELLSSNGMLVKRPLLLTDKGILIGFKEKEWKEILLNN